MSRYVVEARCTGPSFAGVTHIRAYSSDDLAEAQAMAREWNKQRGDSAWYVVDSAPEEVRYDLGEQPIPVWLRLS